MKLTGRAQEALDKILKSFETGQVPEAITASLLPRLDVPSNRWSLNNRLLMVLAGTADARGIGQWREVGRWPKKGSKAAYILVPMHVCKKVEDGETVEASGEQVLVGFRCCPVFAVEDTEGEPVAYPDLVPTQPPPLSEVARAWGLDVTYLPGNGCFDGYYSPSQQRIGLCTHADQVFFHELAHAAHHRVKGALAGCSDWREEVVAELAAAALAHLYGRRPDDGGAYRYIQRYAEGTGKDVYRACLSVVADVGRCLELILDQAGAGETGSDIPFVRGREVPARCVDEVLP